MLHFMPSKGWVEFIFVHPRGEYFSHFHFFFFGGAPAVMPICTFQNLDDKYVDGDDH